MNNQKFCNFSHCKIIEGTEIYIVGAFPHVSGEEKSVNYMISKKYEVIYKEFTCVCLWEDVRGSLSLRRDYSVCIFFLLTDSN